MKVRELSFEQAEALLAGKRRLVKLEARHQKVLEEWIMQGTQRASSAQTGSDRPNGQR
jgi:hypothetical protein